MPATEGFARSKFVLAVQGAKNLQKLTFTVHSAADLDGPLCGRRLMHLAIFGQGEMSHKQSIVVSSTIIARWTAKWMTWRTSCVWSCCTAEVNHRPWETDSGTVQGADGGPQRGRLGVHPVYEAFVRAGHDAVRPHVLPALLRARRRPQQQVPKLPHGADMA